MSDKQIVEDDAFSAAVPDTHDNGEGPRPHAASCDGCWKRRICWSCGASIRATGFGELAKRCTNATCLNCHNAGKCGRHPENPS